jgi:23S rRNA pseudouridine1911/1915/1917 synthase
MNTRLEVTAEDAGQRIDWFLHTRLPEYSRSRLQSWIKDQRVKVNGSTVRPSHMLRGGESVEVEPAERPPLKAQPEDLPVKVLYEDTEVIVVDKPAGMVVHSGAGHHAGTLVNALLHHYGSLSAVGDALRPGIVHRLDKDTSGVLVVARTDRVHLALAAQFQKRAVEKIYLTLVHGRPSPAKGTIRTPIARDPIRRTRMTTRIASGREALTSFETLETIGPLSLLRVNLGTGRTHQIRVHLSSIGHPIVGDHLYGAPRTVGGLPSLQRFFLHAFSLRFTSPSSGKTVYVESPLAPELSAWLELARSADFTDHHKKRHNGVSS